MPAAAVIPAPLAYTIIVAVKRLVVGLNCRYAYIRNLAIRLILLHTIFNASVQLLSIYILSFDRIINSNTLEFQLYNYALYNLSYFQHCEQIRVYQTCRF